MKVFKNLKTSGLLRLFLVTHVRNSGFTFMKLTPYDADIDASSLRLLFFMNTFTISERGNEMQVRGQDSVF